MALDRDARLPRCSHRSSKLVLAGLFTAILATTTTGQACGGFKVLVFSKTAGFRHAAQITAGISMIQALGAANGFHVDATEDSTLFTVPNLSQYAVVIFLNTTGNILNLTQEAAFQTFIMGGGGFVGIHSATDTEYTWPFYGVLVGAYFSGHPAVQAADVHVTDPTHPSTAHLAPVFSHVDEWYNFSTNPASTPTTNILLTIDESTYTGGTMGAVHPVAWSQDIPGTGRSWYTAIGHNTSTYSSAWFQNHVLGGILFTASRVRTATLCGMQSYGAASGIPLLSLTGTVPTPVSGGLLLTGGDPAAAGLLFVSTCSDSLLLWPYTIHVDLAAPHSLLQIPFAFDAAGEFQFPLPTTLGVPAALGTTLYFQGVEVAPSLGLSNGVQLTLCP